MGAAAPVLLLLERPGCHLCEEFAEDLAAALPAASFRLETHCVDDRPDWQAAYGRQIPVLLAEDGAVLCRTQLDVAAVRAYVDGQSGT